MKNIKYIVNGRIFNSGEEMERYCKANDFRIMDISAMITPKGVRYVVAVKSNT